MATTTTVSGLPLPEGGDPNDIPGDVGAALTMIDKGWIQHLTAAEIAALPGPKMPAGLVVWNKTFLRHEVSDGTDWKVLATRGYVDAVGTWYDWTPVLSQNGTVTWNAATSTARYALVGDLVTVTMRLAATSAGTLGNLVTVTGLPVAIASPVASEVVGTFLHFDSGTTNRTGAAISVAANANAVTFVTDNDPSGYGVTSGALASGDVFSMTLTYEAAR